MKKRTLGIWAVGMLLWVTGAAFAGVTATIVDAAGDPNSITVTAGASFNVTVQVNTDTSLTALQLKIKEITPPAGIFTLNSVSFSTPPGGVWSSDPNYQYNPTPQTLDDSNGYTSGYIADVADDLVNGTGTGIFDFATINMTFTGPSTLNITYALNLDEIIYGDLNWDEFAGSAGQDYQVTVIPAPGAVVLGMIGLGVVGWLRKRLAGGPDPVRC